MSKRNKRKALMAGLPERRRLRLQAVGWMGDALAEDAGEGVFAFGGIPGEDVSVELVRRQWGHLAGYVTDIHAASPHRVEPVCPYFGECTGCQWQHIAYDHQLILKRERVCTALETIGNMPDAPVSETVPAVHTLGYRNHARFTARRDGSLGFINRITRRFVRIDECRLMHPGINRILSQLQDNCGETTQLSIRYGVNTDDWLIQPALKSESVPVPTGQKYYLESFHEMPFRISSPAFFQVNVPQAERMTRYVRERLGMSGGEVVVDAYAGVGTFAAVMAPDSRKVIAIEESASANQDGRINIQGFNNVELIEDKTENVLGALDQLPDRVILDPPRAGCQPEAIEALIGRPPARVVYVSCDPRALARDLRMLCEGPFSLDEILPIDLFPQTHHIECLATLSRRGPRIPGKGLSGA